MSGREGQAWDGQGLPPVAAERVRRAAAGATWTSLLSAPAAAGLSSTHFEPVGEAMGSIVQKIGWSGFAGCGWIGGGIFGGMGSPEPVAAFEPYVQALYRGYDTALQRLHLEAQALGADGVVGVALTTSHLGQGAREFSALGTAVRSRGPRPSALFSTDLPGQDVAKLVGAGWQPVRIVYGIAVALRHDDWYTRNQTSWGAGNTEVDGHTRLVNAVRTESRHRFERQVARAGAHGAIVTSMGVSMREIEPTENHRDHVAEATVFGNALLGDGRPPNPAERAPLTFLPLRGRNPP